MRELQPGEILVSDNPDFQVIVHPEHGHVMIYFKQHDLGIAFTIDAYRESYGQVEHAFHEHHWHRDQVYDLAKLMWDPENQPPQYTPEQAWLKFNEIMGR